MLCNQKKDKTCLVCGDKALGYNFNAVSCESCKAFFRRNAHKTIRGRCEGKCDINIESRSFCKRCRLAKCFTVGMRKDMILDDNQKKLRKQKILINKLRRHGSLSQEDTYAVSETDKQPMCSTKLASQSKQSLKEQFPNLTDAEIQILHGVGKIESDDRKGKLKVEDKKCTYRNWHDDQERISDLVSEMGEVEKSVLLEMIKAHESSSFLSNTQTRLKNLPKSSTEVFNIADGFVRRIIKVAKQLSYFRSIDKDDQIFLLKGSVVEIMMLRSAVNFDAKTESWNLSTTSCIKHSTGSDTASTVSSPGSAGSASNSFDFSAAATGLDINKLRQAAMSGADLNTLRAMARQSSQEQSKTAENQELPVDVDATSTADINSPRHMARQSSRVENTAAENQELPVGLNAMSGIDINALRAMARRSSQVESKTSENQELPAGLNAMSGIDINALRAMARRSSQVESKTSENQELPAGLNAMSGIDINALRAMARRSSQVESKTSENQELPAGLNAMSGTDINALRAMAGRSSQVESKTSENQELPAGLNAMSGTDINALRAMARRSSRVESKTSENQELPAGLNAMSGTDINVLRAMAGRSSQVESKTSENQELPAGLNAMSGTDINALRAMARRSSQVESKTSENQEIPRIDQMKQKYGAKEEQGGSDGLDGLRNAAKAAGFDVEALRKAAMRGASLEQLSQLAHSGSASGSQEMPSQIKQEAGQSSAESSISSDILKMGNTETRTMFFTYCKFIKSLMSTISGDLMILKFLIMLSLFSPDRQGVQNPSVIERYQEIYANTLKKYIDLTFPEQKNMFAKCIMKLTDLRNVNEIHTKMLLKMQVEDIEPLLVEIFDLPQ